jgi:hypothetical protein
MKKILILCFTLFSLGLNAQFIVQSPTVTSLTSGRVIALLDLASVTHINTDPGTKIPFTGTIYTNGMTTNAGSITPSQTAKYRADWLCVSPSTEFLADGIFHVVQNGVSVGQVSYNMNEASAVNQCAGFIDVDLIAGQEVSLHYRTRHTTTDGIGWDRGSYFQLTQLPTAVAPVIDAVAEYGENNGITDNQTVTTTLADVAGSSFTLPSAGVWEVKYVVETNVTSTNMTVGLYTLSNILLANSQSLSGGQSTVRGIASQISFITTTGSEVYKLRASVNTGTATIINGNIAGLQSNSKITYQKIAGGLPSTGQTVDKLHVRQNTTQGAPTVNTIINLEGIVSGNIPFANNTVTLEAGKTYLLEGTGAIMAGGSSAYGTRFFNVTTGQFFGESSYAISPNNGNTATFVSRTAVAEITPTVTTQVQLRVDLLAGAAGTIGGSNLVNTGNGAGSNQDPNGASWVRVTQLGSTSNTVGTLPAVDQSSAGYFDIGNMRMQWGSTGSVGSGSFITLPAPFANSNYAITLTPFASGTRIASVFSTTATTFQVTGWEVNSPVGGIAVNAKWIAIGQRP